MTKINDITYGYEIKTETVELNHNGTRNIRTLLIKKIGGRAEKLVRIQETLTGEYCAHVTI